MFLVYSTYLDKQSGLNQSDKFLVTLIFKTIDR